MHQIAWDDLKLAYHVAQYGSLSSASKQLRMSHATLIRHIQRLEKELGVTLFIRHQRGYALTDAGRLLLEETRDIERSIGKLTHHLHNHDENVSGTINITTINEYAYAVIPLLKKYQDAIQHVNISLVTTDTLMPLNTGETHVAIRAGFEPNDPDVIVKKLFDIDFALFASKDYSKHWGLPEREIDFGLHKWVLPLGQKREMPMVRKILNHVDESQIVFQSNNCRDMEIAIEEGMGIGFIDVSHINRVNNIVPVFSQQLETGNALWLMYHRNSKTNEKIRLLCQIFKKAFEHDRNSCHAF